MKKTRTTRADYRCLDCEWAPITSGGEEEQIKNHIEKTGHTVVFTEGVITTYKQDQKLEAAQTVQGVYLTELESTLLKAVTKDTTFWAEVEDIRHGNWAFAVYDEMERITGTRTSTAGVASSLVKKGLIEVWENDGQDMLNFTELGYRIMLVLYPEYVAGHSGF